MRAPHLKDEPKALEDVEELEGDVASDGLSADLLPSSFASCARLTPTRMSSGELRRSPKLLLGGLPFQA